MTTLLLTVAAIAVSTLAVLWLRRIDPKRTRVLNKSATGEPSKPMRLLGWALALLPMAALIALGNIAAFIIWLAAMTVIGWLLARQRGPMPNSLERVV
ncbi:MAG: hypothetical protein AAF936_08335 [Pseudomonadota bacterium]